MQFHFLFALMLSSRVFRSGGASAINRVDLLPSLTAKPLPLPLLLLVTAAWFVLGNWMWPLLNPDEGRYVGVALEMLQAHRWDTPLLNGMPYFHKPPLFYWLTAASLSLFGQNEFAGRLVPALAGLLMVGALFVFLRRFVAPACASTASIILAATPLMFGAAHYANLDLLVAAMISGTILCGATAVLLHQQGQSYLRWVLAMYLFAALGFLAKGLIGFVLPGAVLLFWLLAERRYSAIAILLRIAGIALFLAIVVPWLLLMQWRYPGFLQYYLVYQQLTRFTQGGFNNAMPVWFYLAILLGSMLPWYRKGTFAVFTRSYWRQEHHASVRRLMWIWLVVILVFFSIPQSKLVGYILPVLPPLAFLLAEFFSGAGSAVTFRSQFTAIQAVPAQQPQRNPAGGAASGHFIARMLLCLIVGVAALAFLPTAALPGSSLIAQAIKQTPPPSGQADQYYSLDYYPFDFGFYMGNNPALTVVSNWADSQLGLKDTWRKELWDAHLFDNANSAYRFALPAAFQRTLCVPASYRRWVLGDARRMSDFPTWANIKPYFTDGRQRVYLLPPGAVMPWCQAGADTPGQ
jgi:4-amino-4-deoxy-L-arabinose transferase-like glycosyltransferase